MALALSCNSLATLGVGLFLILSGAESGAQGFMETPGDLGAGISPIQRTEIKIPVGSLRKKPVVRFHDWPSRTSPEAGHSPGVGGTYDIQSTASQGGKPSSLTVSTPALTGATTKSPPPDRMPPEPQESPWATALESTPKGIGGKQKPANSPIMSRRATSQKRPASLKASRTTTQKNRSLPNRRHPGKLSRPPVHTNGHEMVATENTASSLPEQLPLRPLVNFPAKSPTMWAVTRNERGEIIQLHPRFERLAVIDLSRPLPSKLQMVTPVASQTESGRVVANVAADDSQGPTILYQQAESTTLDETTDTGLSWRMLLHQAQKAHHDKHDDEATQKLESAIPLASRPEDRATIYAALGELHAERQDLTAAIFAYQQADQLMPNPHRLRYAQLLAQNGQRINAVTLLEGSQAQSLPAVQRNLLLGTLQEELGQYAQAINHLEEAARLQPNSSDILYNLGLAMELAGQTAKAHIQYGQALKLDPTASDIQHAYLRTGIAGL